MMPSSVISVSRHITGANYKPKIGYLLKDRISDVGQFIEALQRVAGGGTVLEPGRPPAPGPQPAKPTRSAGTPPRETEVLTLMAEGRSNTAIADALVISARAVEKPIATISSSSTSRPTAGSATGVSWQSCAT
jgi:DNA-binding CsgD family transcriptional regulator